MNKKDSKFKRKESIISGKISTEGREKTQHDALTGQDSVETVLPNISGSRKLLNQSEHT